jgi:chromosome segregation ATPase
MNGYLGLDDLYERQTELALQADSLEAQQERLTQRKTDAELELRWEDADELGEQIDALSDQLGPLRDELVELEEEIAWASERECRRDSPMVL